MSDVKPFVLDFDLVSGFCTSGKVKPTQRRVSDMVAQFANEAAARAMVEGGDPLLYEFYGLDLPEDDSGVLQFGTTILYPGKVGKEYFMIVLMISVGLLERRMTMVEWWYKLPSTTVVRP